ncbi:MAG: hypothetical protein AAGD25_35860 [Cyanobacteria bacterium P01_F01_bin.150]
MMATLGQQIEESNQRIEKSNQRIEESNRRIEENSVYIRGLQAENRNILSLLMDKRQQDDGE